MAKRKIAVLGGGVGAMTTAAWITDPANPNAHDYEVTVYQMGWRLGGKGASGRNADHSERIEEHGLHIWFGCYDNAFRTIRRIYSQLGRAPDAPLGNWRAAFKPHSYIAMMEHIKDQWIPWPSALPTNTDLPGEGNLLLPLHDYILMAVKLLLTRTKGAHSVYNPLGRVDVPNMTTAQKIRDGISVGIENTLVKLFIGLLHSLHFLTRFLRFIIIALVKCLGLFMRWLWRRVRDHINEDTDARREWIVMNFFYANILGTLEERAIEHGIDSLNRYDYREFLGKYAIDDGGIMVDSAWVIGIYDGVFGYVDGDNSIPPGQKFPPKGKVEAGNIMKAGIREFFTYKGASIWKMQAGMGDTIFGPMYEVLLRRGVKFKFFHKVESIETIDGDAVDVIKLTQQAQIKRRDETAEYSPLVDVKGLPCWPSEPLWQQLENGDEMRRAGVDFESYAPQPVQGQPIELRRGEDFDDVVLGISIGALPYVAPSLIDASDAWRASMQHVKTNRTQGCQLWLNKTAFQLGWHAMQRPILTCYEVSPLDTWADLSQLVERENWDNEYYPLNIAYFCGVMKDDGIAPTPYGPMEPLSDFDQKQQNQKAYQVAHTFTHQHLGPLWPDAVSDNGALKWSLLVDRHIVQPADETALQTQYWKANVQPSERYVLSVPGSSNYRLKAHDPAEFSNLYLSGDWIDTGFNLGCVESATMGGMLAANALSSYPDKSSIVGLTLGDPLI